MFGLCSKNAIRRYHTKQIFANNVLLLWNTRYCEQIFASCVTYRKRFPMWPWINILNGSNFGFVRSSNLLEVWIENACTFKQVYTCVTHMMLQPLTACPLCYLRSVFVCVVSWKLKGTKIKQNRTDPMLVIETNIYLYLVKLIQYVFRSSLISNKIYCVLVCSLRKWRWVVTLSNEFVSVNVF